MVLYTEQRKYKNTESIIPTIKVHNRVCTMYTNHICLLHALTDFCHKQSRKMKSGLLKVSVKLNAIFVLYVDINMHAIIQVQLRCGSGIYFHIT
jgi:hypothetical protein